MHKKSKRETIAAVPVTVATVAPATADGEVGETVERHLDQLLPKNSTKKSRPRRAGGRLSQRSKTVSRLYRRGRTFPIRRRSTIAPLVLPNDVATTDTQDNRQTETASTAPATAVPGTNPQVDGEVSRSSLTQQFQTWNGKSVEGTIQKGRIIKQGLDSLDKNEWKAWIIDDLHLTGWSAGLYVHISEHHILSDPKYWKYLPVDYRTLYELSQIDAGKLLQYITKGGVHQDLARDKAVKLKRDSSDKPSKKKPLPEPKVPDALAVLHNVARYFYSDKVWRAHDRQHPTPSELPSKEDIDAGLQWVEMKRAQRKGVRS